MVDWGRWRFSSLPLTLGKKKVRSPLVCSGGDFRKPTQVREPKQISVNRQKSEGLPPGPSCQRKKRQRSLWREKHLEDYSRWGKRLPNDIATTWVLSQDLGSIPLWSVRGIWDWNLEAFKQVLGQDTVSRNSRVFLLAARGKWWTFGCQW